VQSRGGRSASHTALPFYLTVSSQKQQQTRLHYIRADLDGLLFVRDFDVPAVIRLAHVAYLFEPAPPIAQSRQLQHGSDDLLALELFDAPLADASHVKVVVELLLELLEQCIVVIVLH